MSGKEKKKKSWVTTLCGIVVGIGIIITAITPLIDGLEETKFVLQDAWPRVAAGLAAAGLGFFARDNKVSSEDAGAK